mgnify:CR=1 FL=1
MSSRTVRYFLRIFIPLAGLALLGGAFLKIKADEVTMTRVQARQQQALRHVVVERPQALRQQASTHTDCMGAGVPAV